MSHSQIGPQIGQQNGQQIGQSKPRVDWVDYAKGVCIIFVVMMHSTLGVEKAAEATGWMHYVVQFAQPFRMPDFFMISGLFLASVISRPWKRYFDRKVVHFFYFYILWMTIQYVIKAPSWIDEGQTPVEVFQNFLMAFIQPFGTLWFIYILPIFFIMTRLVERIDWRVIFAVAALAEILPIHTGAMIIDEMAARYVYFFAGYKLAPYIFQLASWVMDNAAKATLALLAWAAFNGMATFTRTAEWMATPHKILGMEMPEYLAGYPGVSLFLGGLGAVAVILFSALISRFSFTGFLRYLGSHSIVVYLAFFFPMAVSRIILLKFAPFLDIGTVSLMVTISGVLGAMMLYWATLLTGYGKFLFARPQWAMTERPEVKQARPAMQAAE
ncbi:MAG: acyltransferase [Hyphomicrobiales bacterium]|nr:MAG: acyltransferase [Hyphomicrobiales bacterium]